MPPELQPTTARPRRPRRRRRVLLLCVSVLAALIVAELGLRLAGRRPLLVRQRTNIVWRHDDTLGWSHVPHQVGTFRTGDTQIEVHINSGGLRDEECDYDRNDRRRVLVLGDSFVWGWGVEERDRFSEVMEARLADLEVVNAGVSGYSTDQELLWLLEEGHRYQPDAIVLVICGNDPGGNTSCLVYDKYYKPVFLEDDTTGALTLRNTPVPRVPLSIRATYVLRHGSALTNLLGRLVVDHELNAGRERGVLPDMRPAKERPVEWTVHLCAMVQEQAERLRAPLTIVVTDIYWSAARDGDYGALVRGLRGLGVPVINLNELPGYDLPSMQVPDKHWNAAGHHFVGELLAAELQVRHRDSKQ